MAIPDNVALVKMFYIKIRSQLMAIYTTLPISLRAPFDELGMSHILINTKSIMDDPYEKIVDLYGMVEYLESVWGIVPHNGCVVLRSKHRAGISIYNKLVSLRLVWKYENLRRDIPDSLLYVQFSPPPTLKRIRCAMTRTHAT
jgi:hypothetical protein